QTMSAGSAVADLYLSDSANSIAFRSKRNGGGNASTITLLAPTSYVQGDLMIATISTRGGSGVTITPDAGRTLIRRVDNSTTLSPGVSWKVAAACEGTIKWTLGSQQKAAADVVVYSGADPTNPVDVENGQSTVAATSHATPSITTTGANELIVAHFGNA